MIGMGLSIAMCLTSASAFAPHGGAAPPPPPTPDVPSSPSIATDSTVGELQFSWVDGGSGADGYQLWGSFDGGATYSLLADTDLLGCVDSGYSPSEDDFFKTRAYNGSGTNKSFSAFSDPMEFVCPPDPPAAPSGTAHDNGDGTATVDGVSGAPAGDHYDHIQIYRDGSLLDEVDTGAFPYLDTGAQNGPVAYTFKAFDSFTGTYSAMGPDVNIIVTGG